jgi:hypothetical protein
MQAVLKNGETLEGRDLFIDLAKERGAAGYVLGLFCSEVVPCRIGRLHCNIFTSFSTEYIWLYCLLGVNV